MQDIRFRVGAIIIKDEKLLLVKHDNWPFYYTVGGGTEFGETSEEAVIREIFEELGYKLEIDKLIVVQENIFILKEEKHHQIVIFYLMKNCDNINIIDGTNTDETSEKLYWIPIKDLPETNIIPEFLKTKLNKLCSNNKIEHIISYD